MRIGYLISTLENSGPVNILYNLIKDLPIKEEITIFTLEQEKNNSRIKDFIEIGCKIIELKIDNRDLIFPKSKKIKTIEEKFIEKKIEIIHSHCFRSTLILSKLKTKNIKKLSTLHTNVKEDYKTAFGKIKGRLMSYLYYKALKKLDLNIACSSSIIKYYKKEIKKLIFIQNGVDLQKFMLKNENKKELRKKLKLEEQKIYFISVGSLCKRKDPFFIANTFTNIDNNNVRLIYLGEGTEKNNIAKLNDKRILLRGNVKEVREYLAASDYYISSSNSEGLPNSVLEGLALKLPIILSEIDPHMEILNINSNAGVSFNKEKKNDLKEKINYILSQNYSLMSNEAYKIVKETLNSKEMSRKYYKEYICLTQN
ncbi:glycosyltransferase [uncultured Cetobacterium sp.]|uniref:glycosyltransferase n=1 Tax=uncultured Cetobacterium sp. TaxID=527638 RepID=UPI00260BAB86|nr:glycosyltransferase [uncultured Cetobacterium sp.]